MLQQVENGESDNYKQGLFTKGISEVSRISQDGRILLENTKGVGGGLLQVLGPSEGNVHYDLHPPAGKVRFAHPSLVFSGSPHFSHSLKSEELQKTDPVEKYHVN